MEQPPGSVDDLQPQDLSTSSVPTVIDLTRKGEECVVNATSLDGLRMVKSPGWFPNSAGVNPGLLSETSLSESGGGGGDGSSDITLQSGDHDHIQPDNAFSHTTVTLSYVSRSRVFSTPDPISRHSPLSTVGKFSLHPACDADKGLGETGYSLNQHYLEQVEGPVDLAAQTELLQSLSQDQVGPEDDGGVCVTQEPHEVNGGVVSSDGDMDKHIQEEEQSEHSPSWKNSSSLENGGRCSRSSSGLCAESSPETLTPAAVEEEEEEEEEKGDPEVLFLTKKQDPVVVGDSVGARDLCSLSREYISPLEDPVSPSATSLDGVEDVFVLPQTSSSPSGDNSYLETAEVEEEAVVVVWDGPRTEEAIQPTAGISDHATRLDSSVENKKPAHRRKAVLEPLIDLTDDASVSSIVEEDKPKTVVPHMNGNSKALQRALKAKKLPQRSSRGTRLEAIVMNINSSRYKVSGCIRTNHNKASASQSTVSDSNLADPERNDTVAVGKRNSRVRTSFSTKTVKQKAKPPVTRGKTNNINTDSCKDSTSDSELLSNSKMSLRSTPPKSPQPAMHKRSKKEPEDVSHPVRSPQTTPTKSKNKPSSPSSPHKNSTKQPELLSQPEEIHVARFSPSPSPLSSKSPKKSPGKAKGQAAGSKTPPTAKTKVARTPRRRRKKLKGGQSSSMFSPKEPEIKLKYVNYKEEKRDRSDSFSPFIRVERQQSSPSLCTIINYPEEVRAQHKKGQQQAHTTGYMSAVVPSTSCLQLGRASNHSQHQRALVCCLCGRSANAMDLGDLHGPYYPEGYQVPSAKTPTSIKEDEDDYTDSDSSSCSVRGGRRRRKCAVPPPTAPPSWSFRQGAQLKQKGLLENHDSGVSSPAVKRARMDAVSTDVEDWYSPPMLPLEPCEYWLHEDCGIWSVGVFLVKGKVYGLEEAVRVAQETMCSACRDPGATLGCFFKGCPNKYHYRCALESDCVLIEENFSMKCKKHKNKTFKAPPGNRWDDR